MDAGQLQQAALGYANGLTGDMKNLSSLAVEFAMTKPNTETGMDSVMPVYIDTSRRDSAVKPGDITIDDLPTYTADTATLVTPAYTPVFSPIEPFQGGAFPTLNYGTAPAQLGDYGLPSEPRIQDDTSTVTMLPYTVPTPPVIVPLNLNLAPINPLHVSIFNGIEPSRAGMDTQGLVDAYHSAMSDPFKARLSGDLLNGYSSANFDKLKAKLQYDLDNGGYGIEPADEKALWNRARERELLGAEAAMQDAARQFAARGFQALPGFANAQMRAVQAKALESSNTLSRDIMLKRADLYVQNRQFTIQQVIEVEKILVNYLLAAMDRAMNVARATVEFAVAAANARVAVFNAEWEGYKAELAAFEAQVRADAMAIEYRKSEVEVAKMQMDAQNVSVEVYRAELGGVQTIAEIYRAELDAKKSKYEVDRLRLEAFKTHVDIYAARVAAKNSEYAGYESRIRGETAKVGAYEAQVRAYSALVESKKAEASVEEMKAKAASEARSIELELKKADYARFGVELEAYKNKIAAKTAKHSAETQKYIADIKKDTDTAQSTIESGKINADLAMTLATMKANDIIKQAQIIASENAAAAGTLAALSKAYGEFAGSALSMASGLTISTMDIAAKTGAM